MKRATAKHSKSTTRVPSGEFIEMHNVGKTLGKKFARASRAIDEDSTSGAALTALEILSDKSEELNSHAMRTGFCDGVSEELRRAAAKGGAA